ncbi:lanthionine synthetase LanC family protein [uncultured Kordia sp.]|uniref:lanthionine synthetase LanC family protein n=1 Tax=uncultured Kordia sp. TaxID=507699 RepID=UPI002613E1A8|nr:lanthionine synthetase LanC family protein [uncultured Kordia sp.]
MNNIETTLKKDVQMYVKTAHNIGKYLAKEALWYKDMCNWTSHEVAGVGGKFETVVKACGIELYSGLTGIALFLTELYDKTQDPIILHTLNGTLKTIYSNLEGDKVNNFGYYSGKIGIGYTLWKIGKKSANDQLVTRALSYVKSVKDQDIADYEVDIISGAAGSISVLLKLYYAEQDEDFLDIAKKCGEFLLKKAMKQGEIYSWMTVDKSNALTGYSHGASGIASALMELYATTKEEQYWHAAMGGYNYEKQWYNQQTQNWPDLREYDGKKPLTYGVMWCHGAPGIAIAHLKAYEMTQHEYFLQEAKIAIETTKRTVIQETNINSNANFSLCHGLAGNADILLYASQILNNPEYAQIAKNAGDFGIAQYDATGVVFPSGVNDPSGQTIGQDENAGLMLGMSGTGMFYLRLADMMNIPSALVP